MSTQTPATKFLAQHGVAFTLHPSEYEEKGGTKVSALKLGAAADAGRVRCGGGLTRARRARGRRHDDAFASHPLRRWDPVDVSATSLRGLGRLTFIP